MGKEIEAAFERFNAISADLGILLRAPLNESDTRFKILDRILVEVLGWDFASIHTEPPTPDGFIDYLVRPGDGRAALVIEAKRNGRLVPASNAKGVSNLSLGGTVLKPLLQTVKQALRYATDEGVPFAAVTDGNCWVFFKASRTDGKKPIEGKAIVFRDLETVREGFAAFYELLGPLGLRERRNAVHLAKAEGLAVADAEEHFYVSDPHAAKMLPPQKLASDAALLFTNFFSRLSDEGDEEMLAECFVATSESNKADTELKKIAQNLVNTIRQIETVEGAVLQQEVKRAIDAQRSETILLVGNKGSGKSTFVRRFFRSVLDPSLRSQCAVMSVDLEGFHGALEDVQAWTIKEMRKQVEKVVLNAAKPTYDDLQGVFWDEYSRWRDVSHKNLYENDKVAFKIEFERHIDKIRDKQPDEYVQHLLHRCVHSNRLLPCIVFDNTDQFGPEVQDAVYQIAHAIGTKAPVLNIVPITDRTVWRLGKSGALQSYPSRSFFLPVPEAKKIIEKRVSFVKAKLEGEPGRAHAYFSAKGFQIGLKDLSFIADAIEGVLVQQDYVSGLIGRLGNFDIRRMLKIAERIFLSPEIRIDEIVRSHFSGRPITTDTYRTYRALIKGEYDRFSDEENGYVTNVFLTDPQHPSSPLLLLYLLTTLKAKSAAAKGGDADERHWRVSDLVDYMEIAGSPPEATERALQKLLTRGLIESFDPNTTALSSQDLVAVKEAGVAHLEITYGSSTYLEQCALSTGISDREVRDRIKELLKGRNKDSFIAMRDVFIDHVLRTDARHIVTPTTPEYRLLADARKQLRAVKSRDR